MMDLILDAPGGSVGAIVGTLYMRISKRHRARVRAFARRLAMHERT
jgi:ClpP class serine protease